jgi:hypothetical protein
MKLCKVKKIMKKFWLLQQTSQIITTVFVTVLLMTFATIVNAAEKKPDAGWHFAITPYIWLPTITASMKLEQPSGFTSGKMDAGPNNYLDNLDFAGMLDVQAKKGKWSFLADVIYLDFSDSESAQFPQVLPLGGDWTVGTDWELQGLVLELAGAYSAFRNEHSNFDLLAGVRYIQMDGKVKLNITGAPPGWVPTQTFSESESFFDPIVGFKGKFELGKKWHLPYYLDSTPSGTRKTASKR